MVATVALGEIARMVGGGTPSRSNPNYYDGVIPWVTPKDMKSWDIYDSQIRLTKDGVDNSATKIIAADSVLVVVRSGVLKHTLPVGINRRPVAINQDIKALICEDVIVPDYLGRCLKAKSGEVLGWVRATTADNIPVDKLKELQIPLPSIDEQKRIVEVLDQADALTVKRRQAVSLLEDLLQSTFSEMFGSSAGDFPTVTVDDLLADRKNAIRTGPFGSQLLHGEFVSSGIPVLGIDNAVHNEFRWGQRRFITEEKFRNLARYQVFPGDVIITIMGTCGRCAVVPEGIGVAINTKHLCCISLDHSKCLPEFLHSYFLMHPIARAYLRQTAKGAIMSGLNMGLIKALPVAIPPISLQERYVTVAGEIKAQKRHHLRQLEELDELFDSLQSRAFCAEL